ncbi:venom allergen 3-like [Diachasmimorpha longicaudata]|uniref:venom allergen 3-like n=1 Tax=Diachasmimorpha longicaudata TaxID=58733 RepID=UPI0030B909D1
MIGILIQLLILGCPAVVRGERIDFCSITSCNNRPHTLCLYPSKTPAASCGLMKDKGLTSQQKQAILARHNHWRSYVANGKEVRGVNGPQPAAKNLGPLTWNDEIAETAQRWADQCKFQHDQCRNTPTMYVGQNIGFMSSTAGWNDENLLKMVDNWYNEVEDFDASIIRSFRVLSSRGRPTGHYTQMVSATTTMLGCGATKFKRKNDAYHISLLVCNYAPSGNWVGQAVYEVLE